MALGDIDQDRPDEEQDDENDVKVFGKDHSKVGQLAETLFSTVESEIERVRLQTGLHRYDLHRQQPYSGYGPKQKQTPEKKVKLCFCLNLVTSGFSSKNDNHKSFRT